MKAAQRFVRLESLRPLIDRVHLAVRGTAYDYADLGRRTESATEGQTARSFAKAYVTTTERILLGLLGAIFLVALLYAGLRDRPITDPGQLLFLRLVAAVSAAACAGLIPGLVEVRYRGILRASGALAIFVIVWFTNPPILVSPQSESLPDGSVRLEATPRHVCPGDPVELTWAFDGSGTMTVTPPSASAPTGLVAYHGEAVIRPMVNATVDLTVTRRSGEPAGRRLDIEMARGETMAASLADSSATCHDGVVTSTAHVRNFAPNLTVQEVEAPPSHARTGYDVTHVDERTRERVTAHVAPGAPTTRFTGLLLAGDWIISSPLAPGESCAPPQLPANLIVVAYTQCVGGGGGTP